MIICFITYKYPGKHNTSDYTFVKQLVDAIADMGNRCIVLSPFNITHYRRLYKVKEEYICGKGSVTVLRPRYLSFSNFAIGKFYLSIWFHKKALKKAFRMMNEKPDIIYGHFWSSAYQGYEYARQYGIPLFVATGESDVAKMFSPRADYNAFCNYISGVICVSTKNREESIRLGLTLPDKCKIFPNAVNSTIFKKMSKQMCREQLGFPQDVFIVIFIGWFIERKGSMRVSQAIKMIVGKPVYSIFVGRGDQEPECDDILYKGSLPHDKVPVYLNAADVFVLPTLQEGCCNAVIEAMACGLPIISSNLPFNWDVLNENNSILVDPTNIYEISAAIERLRDDADERLRLAQGALETAKSLTIEQRAKGIVSFIESQITS